jgi:hypothetical protein
MISLMCGSKKKRPHRSQSILVVTEAEGVGRE